MPEIVRISKNVDHLKPSKSTIGLPESNNTDQFSTSKSTIFPPDLDNNISAKNTQSRRVQSVKDYNSIVRLTNSKNTKVQSVAEVAKTFGNFSSNGKKEKHLKCQGVKEKSFEENVSKILQKNRGKRKMKTQN